MIYYTNPWQTGNPCLQVQFCQGSAPHLPVPTTCHRLINPWQSIRVRICNRFSVLKSGSHNCKKTTISCSSGILKIKKPLQIACNWISLWYPLKMCTFWAVFCSFLQFWSGFFCISVLDNWLWLWFIQKWPKTRPNWTLKH